MNKKVYQITNGAMIAAVYVVLTVFINAFNLANGAIQVRLSEALTILPAFIPAAIPGLYVGCLISNIVTGCVIWDIIFGPLATLVGAIFTYLISNNYWKKEGRSKAILRLIAPLPPIVANTVVVPLVLRYGYGIEGTIPFLALTIFIGEVISCGVLGLILMSVIENRLLKYITPQD